MTKKVYLASDHAGFHLKKYLIKILSDQGYEFEDLGPDSVSSVDYPDYIQPVCKKVQQNENSFGILVCGSGIGMSIGANKFKGIRAALVSDPLSAKLTRAHNNANILCLGERIIGFGIAEEILINFLNTAFEGDRHQRRIDKISNFEE